MPPHLTEKDSSQMHTDGMQAVAPSISTKKNKPVQYRCKNYTRSAEKKQPTAAPAKEPVKVFVIHGRLV